MKILRLGLYIISSFFLILSLLLALLIFNPRFNHWLIQHIITTTPSLSIEKVEGLLFSDLQLHGIYYQDKQAEITIATATYQFDLSSLFAQTLKFNHLHISHIDVILTDTEPTAEQEAISFVMPIPLSVDHLLIQDIKIKQAGQAHTIDSITAQLLYQKQTIEIKQFALVSDRATIQGVAILQISEQLPFTAELDLSKAETEWGALQAHLKLHGNLQKIYLQSAIHSPAELQTQGWIKLESDTPEFDLKLVWESLPWPLQGKINYALNKATLTLQGTLDGYQLALQAEAYSTAVTTGKLHLTGLGDRQQFNINNLSLEILKGTIHSAGRLSWTESIPSQLQLSSEKIDLKPLLGYPSLVSLETQLTGNLLQQKNIHVSINQLAGKIRDKEMTGTAQAHYDKQQLLIKKLQLQIGKNSLAVKGAIGTKNSDSKLSFDLNALDLQELSADLKGSAIAQGSVQGSLTQPSIQFKLTADNLKFQQQHIAHLQAKGNVITAGKGQLELELKARKIQLQQTEIEHLHLQAQGEFAQHKLSAKLDSAQGKLQFSAQGAWNANTQHWQGVLEKFKLQQTEAGLWQLNQPSPLQFTLAEQSVIRVQTDLCLKQASGTGRACLTTYLDPQLGQKLTADIQQLPLSLFKPWLPENLKIDSSLQARFSLHKALQPHAPLLGDINLNIDAGTLTIQHSPTDTQTLSFQSVQWKGKSLINEGQSNLESKLSLRLNDKNTLQGKLNITGLEHTESATIDSQLEIQLADMQLLESFLTSVSDVEGKVTALIRLQGLLSAPSIDGSHAQIALKKLFIPEIGLQLDDINIALAQTAKQQLSLQGEVYLAKKPLVINGVIEQFTNQQFNYKATVKGDTLQLFKTPEMQVWVSPDLHLIGDQHGAKLIGKLVIPKAELIFESLPEGAVSLSDDEIIVNAGKTATKESRYPLDADLQISLNEEAVSVEGFGLKAHLKGELHAVRKKSQLKLYHTLNIVKGTYQAYGQDLEIEKAQLLFTGDMQNLGVNILAARKATDWDDKTVAYLRMTGTLKNPETTIYTVPALPESEALAYLLTGSKLGESDANNTALLAKAALSLGREYVDALMGVVGIDELEIKSTSLGQNSMVIGKRITSDLYARYIMDVLTAEMQFAVIYKLTKHISIETRAGTTHSSDIKYNIEFD
ncbi:MAG: hypothetical protein GQ582_13480 [Methyloprofundus sp.]|nr:hypothetical protein [Methyloprofundus sp.]